MCTASWLQQDGGFQLLCNRDEKRTRVAAVAPAAEWIDGVRVLAPRDEQGGGAWVERPARAALIGRVGRIFHARKDIQKKLGGYR